MRLYELMDRLYNRDFHKIVALFIPKKFDEVNHVLLDHSKKYQVRNTYICLTRLRKTFEESPRSGRRVIFRDR